MSQCSVNSCTNHNLKTKNSGIRYLTFPKNPEMRDKWIKVCKNDNLNLTTGNKHFVIVCYLINSSMNYMKYSSIAINLNSFLTAARICSTHFTQDCFEKKPEHLIVPGDRNIFKLSKNAISTENLDLIHNDSKYVS